jgi:ERCC4-related helicase
MIERFEQIEKNTKQIFKEMRQQLILVNSLDHYSMKANDKLLKLEDQLSTEISRLNSAYFELAKVYNDMITSPNLKERLEAVRLQAFFSCFSQIEPTQSLVKRKDSTRYKIRLVDK